MKQSLWNAVAANLALFALGAMVSCSCLCGRPDSGVGSAPSRSPGQSPSGKGEAWRFVVSGDSRNCGDVVMPAIAAGAKLDGAQFYWHLGDLRAIFDFDEDMLQEAKMANKHLTISAYEKTAWDDFYKNQVAPFENIPVPFYLGIGNHETYSPKSRCEFVKRFSALLDKPELQGGKAGIASQNPPIAGRPASAKSSAVKGTAETADKMNSCVKECADCEALQSKTYYHWTRNGIDFIYLDNATGEQFDDPQLKWLNAVLSADENDTKIGTVVVGMHEALPWSVSCSHSMNESQRGIESGVQVYQSLLNLRRKDKKVYVLASHSHYYLNDIFNTEHWRKNGGVLPGWIVGTAGAQRYPLPKSADLSRARANVYGYLLGRVFSNGTIDFEFTELKVGDVPQEVMKHYSEPFVRDTCFAENRRTDAPEEKEYCKENP